MKNHKAIYSLETEIEIEGENGERFWSSKLLSNRNRRSRINRSLAERHEKWSTECYPVSAIDGHRHHSSSLCLPSPPPPPHHHCLVDCRPFDWCGNLDNNWCNLVTGNRSKDPKCIRMIDRSMINDQCVESLPTDRLQINSWSLAQFGHNSVWEKRFWNWGFVTILHYTHTHTQWFIYKNITLLMTL